MLRTWRLLVSDTSTGSGYAYLDERGRLGAAGREQPAYRRAAAVGRAGRGARGADRAARHGRQPVGARRRVRRPAGAAPGGLPGAARDETARAVRSQRCPAVARTSANRIRT